MALSGTDAAPFAQARASLSDIAEQAKPRTGRIIRTNGNGRRPVAHRVK